MKGIFAGRDLGSAQGGQCDAPCLGYSYVNSEPVTDTFGRVLPVTLSIVIPAAILWLLLGIGLGMVSALRRGTRARPAGDRLLADRRVDAALLRRRASCCWSSSTR